MQEEIWKDIKGFEGIYQVSSLGRVKSLDRIINRENSTPQRRNERILKPAKDRHGYWFVTLRKNNKNKCHRIHRLIAEAFIPNPENKPHIDHIDTNPLNNSIDNLRWCTHAENMNNTKTKEKHSMIMENKKGSLHPRSRKIVQFTINNEIIKEWDSMADVTRELGIAWSTISDCCRYKKETAGGFKWRYAS